MIGPTKEDISKLNAEVNQIVNQRFTLSTLAITVFGVIFGWIIAKSPPSAGGEVGAFVFGAVILLICILFALFLLSHQLSRMLRVFTTYLDESGASNWEKDWALYRKKFSYLGYTKPQGLVFLFLGILAALLPFLYAVAYQLRVGPFGIARICVGLDGLYILLVSGMAFAGWFGNEEGIRQRWQDLNKK